MTSKKKEKEREKERKRHVRDRPTSCVGQTKYRKGEGKGKLQSTNTLRQGIYF